MIFFDNLRKEKIVHGITEKDEGDVNPFSNPNASEVILTAMGNNGIKRKAENLIFAEQIHKNRVHNVTCDMGGYIKLGVDALISSNPGHVLVIKTADCIPILIYDNSGKVAAIHAGRKGLVGEVIEETVKSMNADNSNLTIGLGPHIKKCCYHLRGEINMYKKYWGDFLEERDGRYFLDLTGIAIKKLLDLGVKSKNIEESGICTFCGGDRFFSARKRDKGSECFGSFIEMKKDNF